LISCAITRSSIALSSSFAAPATANSIFRSSAVKTLHTLGILVPPPNVGAHDCAPTRSWPSWTPTATPTPPTLSPQRPDMLCETARHYRNRAKSRVIPWDILSHKLGIRVVENRTTCTFVQALSTSTLSLGYHPHAHVRTFH
jgi:hypothetical protein